MGGFRKRVSGVYLIRNQVNGKCYVGSTNDRETRWRGHRQTLNNGTHTNPHLQSAWRLYGEDAFEFVWIADVPVKNLLDEEQKLLDAYPNGYNVERQARKCGRGYGVSDESRRRRSEAHRGKVRSAETRAKISAVQKGKKRGPLPESTRKKIGDAHRGKVITEKHRQQIRDALTGRKLAPHEIEILRQRMIGNQYTKGIPLTDEHKRKIKENHRHLPTRLGAKQTEEEKAKRSASLRAFYQRKREKIAAREVSTAAS